MKQTNTRHRSLREIVRSLHKTQIIAIVAVFVLITGTASAATVAKVNSNRAQREQERVLRTTNLETASDGQSANKTTKTTDDTEKKPETTTQQSTATAPRKTATVSFTKGGAGLQGSTVVVSFTANAPLNGTCNYTFTLGASTVSQSNGNTGQTCAINVPLSSFVKSGNWSLDLKYVSADNYTQGSVGGVIVSIVPEVRTINFTKGGAGQNGDVVTASSNLSESQSGTCTFTFSLNGTVRVNQTVAISNSNKCAANIPISLFPKSATYSYTLSFVSTDTLTIANQSAFDVDVM